MSDPAESLRQLLVSERLLLEQRERHEFLSRRRQEMASELQSLHRDIAETVRQLEQAGRARVELGDLRRLTPISPVWGLDRGIPLDRYYIHSFLERHRADIHGRVLEVKDSGYTRMFGGDRVTTSDVVDINPLNERATITVDLSQADAIGDCTYDCFILTQTLGVIFDVAGALRHAARILKPGGVLLCTVPAMGRISYEEGLDGDYWRFTEGSVRRLFASQFPLDACEIHGHGNVLSSTAFLYGLAPDELTKEELDTVDPYFPVVYTIRATRPVQPEGPRPAAGAHAKVASNASQESVRGIVLRYHRVADQAVDRHELCVSVTHFRQQMQYLRDAKCRVVPLTELTSALLDTSESIAPVVALTFDDGYVDSLTQVAPILSKYGFPGTFFLTGFALDAPQEFWWDHLDRMFFSGHRLPDTLSVRLPESVFTCQTSSATQRAEAHRRLSDTFYQLDRAGREEVLRALTEWSALGPRPPGEARPMTRDEISVLAGCPGVSIGAHSQHHLWLPALSAEQKRAEVETCKLSLEAVVGRRVASFAYPYGAHDAESEQIVRAAGFDVAVTTVDDAVRPGTNPFLMPRVDAAGDIASVIAGRVPAIPLSAFERGARPHATAR